MTAELGATDDPRALVPGDPAAVAADARVLADRAAGLVRTGQALRRIDTGSWTGAASDAWRQRHDTDVPRWLQAADSLDAAADALRGHADTLGRAQDTAARAITLWRSGEAATAQARTSYDRAAAGALLPAFTDPGDEPRRAARDLLAGARDDLRRSGDRAATALRGEAGLAPRDSRKQSDADFYGGIWDSVAAAGKGAWTLLSDPAAAVAGVVAAAAHPVDAAKDAVAWNDWTEGREPRALGRNTGDMIVGIATLGAGKITSALGRGARLADEPRPHGPAEHESVPTPVASTPAARADGVSAAVLDSGGVPRGVEDSSRVYLMDEAELNSVRNDLVQRLGAPDREYELRKGRVESWVIDPDSGTTVTYRTFSGSGGATIDVNLGREFPVKRLHLRGEGP